MPKDHDIQSASEKIIAHFLLQDQGALRNLIVDSIIEITSFLNANELTEQYAGFNFPKVNEEQFQFLDDNGYLVINDCIPLDACDEINTLILEMAAYESKVKKSGYFYGSGKMQRIYQLLSKDKRFGQVLINPLMLEIMDYLFQRPTFHEKYYLASYHANLLYEGAEPQVWHVDAAVPEPLPSWIIRANANFILHDYTFENGATQVIPGSHKFLAKPNQEEIAAGAHKIVDLVAPKGSIVFWNGHLWHRSGRNQTKNPRVALLPCFAASFLREMALEENPYLFMNQLEANQMPLRLKEIMGWDHGAKDY